MVCGVGLGAGGFKGISGLGGAGWGGGGVTGWGFEV